MGKFAIVSAGVILTRAADLYTTYLMAPDFRKESNPIVRLLGDTGGWLAVLLFESALLAVLLFLEYLRIRRPTPDAIRTPGLKFSEYVSLNYSNRRSRWLKAITGLPLNRRLFVDLCGYMGTRCLLVSSLVVSLSSACALLLPSYRQLYVEHHLWNALYVSIVLTVGFYGVRFYRLRYLDYRKKVAG